MNHHPTDPDDPRDADLGHDDLGHDHHASDDDLTTEDDFVEEEFVEAEWDDDAPQDYRQERPRGLFDEEGPLAHLFRPDGPFGKGGVFGPGGPFGQQSPFGPNGPFSQSGPFGKGGPRGRRGGSFQWPSDETSAFSDERGRGRREHGPGPRGRGDGPRGRGGSPRPSDTRGWGEGPRGWGEGPGGWGEGPGGRPDAPRRGDGPRGRGRDDDRHDKRRGFVPEHSRPFDQQGPGFGPQDSADAWARATDGPRGPRGSRGDESRGRRGGPQGPRGRGRRRRGDVRTAALLLIGEEPRNGYQIIEELAARTGGHWRPSSGAVYPALAQLEDEGLIEAFDNEGRKAYRLTDAGQQAATEAGDRPRPWDEASQDAAQAFGGRTGGSMWSSLAQVGMAAHAVTQAGDDALVRQATGLLDETRKALYRLLAEDANNSSETAATGDQPADETPADAGSESGSDTGRDSGDQGENA